MGARLAETVLHRRQFVIDTQAHRVHEQWLTLALGHGLTLSYCPDLDVRPLHDAESRQWLVMGVACDPEYIGPAGLASLIKTLRTDEVPGATYRWLGRWALIGPDSLLPDASSLLGIYYYRSADGRCLISSSISLLYGFATRFQLEPPPLRIRRKLGGYGPNWFPPPASQVEGIKKLLPDQTVCLKNFHVEHRRRLQRGRYDALSTNTRAELLLKDLAGALHALASGGRKVLIALTAGIDSRCTLAAALAARLDIETYTIACPGLTRADRTLPPKIASHCGVPHRYISPTPRPSWLTNSTCDAHTLIKTVHRDRFPSNPAYSRLPADAWNINSVNWELGRAYFYRSFPDMSLAELARDPHRFVSRFRAFGSRALLSRQFQEWFQWRHDHDEGHDWKDLYCRDQKQCGWVSLFSQAHDMLDCPLVPLINGDRFFDILLSETLPLRQEAAVQKALLRFSAFDLDRFPINPPEPFTSRKIIWQRRVEGVLGETWNWLQQ